MEYPGYNKVWMSDGTILRNYGSGWKLTGKCKPGVDPVAHAAAQRAYYANITPDRVMRAAYRDRMVSLFPSLEVRVLANVTISMMPTDADGCWSEFDDRMSNHNITVEEWGELCCLYLSASNEGAAAKAAKQQAVVA